MINASTASRPLDISATLKTRMVEANYLWRHHTLAAGMGLAAVAWNRLLQPVKRPTSTARQVLRQRLHQLFRDDLDNARRGIYSHDLLLQLPMRQYARQVPKALGEFPKIYRRKRKNAFDDLPSNVSAERYPAYYRRTFHWQSDGWLSTRSAELYDPGVEFLFGGTADIMRRMGIPPLLERRHGRPPQRLLDVGCGTGRFIEQLLRASPHVHCTGLDMSRYYLDFAAKHINEPQRTQWVEGAGESMPFEDAEFDAVTSVFLFHELPKDIRRHVAQEMLRVLTPGGQLVIIDSIQATDTPELADVLLNFPATYHEPYYKSYMRDDLARLLAEVGFTITEKRNAFVSRVVVAEKPMA